MIIKRRNKIIGDWNPETNTFNKEVKQSKHLMKIFDAWGIDASYLNQLPPTAEIVIKDTESGTIYSTTARNYTKEGMVREFGHGRQVFLPRRLFRTQKQLDPL